MSVDGMETGSRPLNNQCNYRVIILSYKYILSLPTAIPLRVWAFT